MHAEAYDFIQRVVAETPVLQRAVWAVELGAFNVNGSARECFPRARWTGVDWRPGPGVDVVCLAHQYRSAWPVDLVLCTEMLEHDPYWRASLQNAAVQCAEGGSVLVTCAGPGRPPHELHCAPDSRHYYPVSATAVVQQLRIAADWSFIWAEQWDRRGDVYVAAIGKRPRQRPTVSVVMGAVGLADQTAAAVESVRRRSRLRHEIVLVDNGSSDADAQALRALAPAVYLRFEQPLGFPAAYNRGLQVAAGEYVALANNDVEIETDGWDEKLRDVIALSPLDMVSPTFDRVANPAQQHREDDTPFAADVLFFVLVLSRRSLFARVGVLDEGFGLGNSEDVDLSLRIQAAGGRLWVHPGVRVRHRAHATFRRLLSEEDFQLLIAKNKQRLMEKHGWRSG